LFLFTRRWNDEMKRIALLSFGMLLLISNTAEARLFRRTRGGTYSQPVQVAPATHTVLRPTTAPRDTPASSVESTEATPVQPTSATSAEVTTVSYSTSTAQGVANLMAAYNRVGHWGGNPGYEGCGCGATPAAAYNICCYGNSGMTTVDVGYARSANGMWFCCRRYR
jgi:hypothetical protein